VRNVQDRCECGSKRCGAGARSTYDVYSGQNAEPGSKSRRRRSGSLLHFVQTTWRKTRRARPVRSRRMTAAISRSILASAPARRAPAGVRTAPRGGNHERGTKIGLQGDRACGGSSPPSTSDTRTPALAGGRCTRGRAIRNGAGAVLKAALTGACCTGGMAKPPRSPPPQKRNSDLPPHDAVASPAVLPRKRDPRQASLRRAAAGIHHAAAGQVRDGSAWASAGLMS
jgi:hypothetical protein